VNTQKTICYECGGEVSPIATTCPSCGAPLPFGPQLPANFHVARKGKRFGPYTEFTARNYLAQGSIRRDDLCWQPGMATWLPVSNVLKPRPAIEAPPNCEARLTQLRGEQQHGADKAREIRENISQQPAPEPRQTKKILSIDALRISIGKTIWDYDDLTDAEKEDLLSRPEYANYPQPIDYGLTRDDVNLYTGQRVYRVDDNLRYKEGRRWFGRLIVPPIEPYKAGGLAFWLLLFGGLMTSGKDSRLGGLIFLGLGLACLLYAIVPGAVIAYQRKHPYAGLQAFEEALRRHHLYEIAVYEAQQALLKRKHSYWERLDGYEFERATAEVMKRHQFNPRVTPGSADGGVDIEVTRNGLRGVVQCKAHVACVGPHVVRDLYGVIHHCGASFGIIVSRGGFTRGAIDFARDKPILFLDTDDLIAMQEGRDVLAEAFTRTDT